MRMRESRATLADSMSTTIEIEDREHLSLMIRDKLSRIGLVVTDKMIHVTHYGFDDRIDWDEHIIVVEGFGVFGFTDEPCPAIPMKANPAPNMQSEKISQRLFSAEVEKAYGLAN